MASLDTLSPLKVCGISNVLNTYLTNADLWGFLALDAAPHSFGEYIVDLAPAAVHVGLLEPRYPFLSGDLFALVCVEVLGSSEIVQRLPAVPRHKSPPSGCWRVGRPAVVGRHNQDFASLISSSLSFLSRHSGRRGLLSGFWSALAM